MTQAIDGHSHFRRGLEIFILSLNSPPICTTTRVRIRLDALNGLRPSHKPVTLANSSLEKGCIDGSKKQIKNPPQPSRVKDLHKTCLYSPVLF